MRIATPPSPEYFKPPKSLGKQPESGAIKGQSVTLNRATSEITGPLATAVKDAVSAATPAAVTAQANIKRLQKRKRAEKPVAFKPTAKINLNCTLNKREEVNAAAEALGLTTTAYLLYCEEKAVHELVKVFTTYIEARQLMFEQQLSSILERIERAIRNRTLNPPGL